MTLYLDASVIVPTLVQEVRTGDVNAFLRSAAEPVVIGDFAAAEVCSALSRLVRTKELSAAGAEQRLIVLDVVRASFAERAVLQPADVAAADRIVRRFELKLRTPDALHVVVARRLGATLVTLDDGLAAAARALGLRVAVPV